MSLLDIPQTFSEIQPSNTLAERLTYAYQDDFESGQNKLLPVWGSLKHSQVRGYQTCAGLALEAAFDLGPPELLKGLVAGVVKGLPGYTGRHFLQHMATGSGKTLLIAETILSLYQRGYRRFIFLVNQTSILDKTRNNLLPSLGHPKCEFGQIQPLANGYGGFHAPRIVEARGRFFQRAGQDIEILFTTIHDLHNQITQPNSKGLAIENLNSEKFVIIGDEAHHFNAHTRKGEVDEEEATWERTIETLMKIHKDNRLVEFSATIDMENKEIQKKYAGRVVFDLPLKTLRSLGYSKNIELVQSLGGPLDRTLFALMVSQFRSSVAQENKVGVVPRVLIKSTGEISDLEKFYKKVMASIANLDVATLKRLASDFVQGHSNPVMKEMSKQIKNNLDNDSWASVFLDQIKANFGPDNTLVYHSKLPAKDLERARVSLSKIDHDPDRRLLFAVNALNEGMDILSLFDIVKIDDNSTGGKSSVAEVQLIGRGTRYFPLGDGEARFVRKYDADPSNPLAFLETMTFHSSNDNTYITSIRKELVKSGLMEDRNPVRINPRGLPEWVKQAAVFGNYKTKRQNSIVSNVSEILKGQEIVLPVSQEDTAHSQTVDTEFISRWSHLFNRGLRHFPLFDKERFVCQFKENPLVVLGNLKNKFFITSPYSDISKAPFRDQQLIIRLLVNAFHERLVQSLSQYFGIDKMSPTVTLAAQKDGKTNFFGPIIIAEKDIYDFSHIRISHYPKMSLDSGLEESLVLQLAEITGDDPNRFWLIRNPNLSKLYKIDDGSEFRPDFILLRNDGKDKKNRQCVTIFYIEAKGEHLSGLETQTWKEGYLQDFVSNQKTIEHENFVYKLQGLPFFKTEHVVKEDKSGNAAWSKWSLLIKSR